MTAKKSQRAHHCRSQHGYLENDSMCIKYYRATALCIAIAKDDDNGKWYLDSNRYEQDSYGCGFREGGFDSDYKLDTPINSLHVWKKIAGGSVGLKNFDSLFPLEPEGSILQIRHGGDPLLAALNVSHAKLDFGKKSSDLKFVGMLGVIVSLLLFSVVGFLTVRKYRISVPCFKKERR